MKEPNQKDILEDEEEFEDMDDDYFAAIGNSYEILSSYDVKVLFFFACNSKPSLSNLFLF